MTLLLMLFLSLVQAQPSSEGTAKLERMVQERQSLHQQWQNSESKKSGIFGNRTKKDMVETNTWLERIIDKDNQIIEELKFSGKVETAVIGQEKDDYKTITQSLERDVQILKRALAERDKSIETMESTRRTFEWTTLIFFLTTLGLGFFIYRLKKS